MESAFKIAEENRDGLDAGFVSQILESFFLNLADRRAILPLLFCLKVQIFQSLSKRGLDGHVSRWTLVFLMI